LAPEVPQDDFHKNIEHFSINKFDAGQNCAKQCGKRSVRWSMEAGMGRIRGMPHTSFDFVVAYGEAMAVMSLNAAGALQSWCQTLEDSMDNSLKRFLKKNS
jgi:hypothetical protein